MQTRGVGPRTLQRVLSQLAGEGGTPEDLVAAPADTLTRFGLKPEAARAVAAARGQAERLADELERQGVQMLVCGTASYPARLSRVLQGEAPPVLFLKGNTRLLERKAAAFCGARDVSEAGLRWTRDLANHLAERAVNVVSGHANGVDLAAHVAALAAEGTTTLVLGEGILRFQAKPGLAELLEDGNYLVVSEFAPRLPWSVGNAMQRNATVCGLADAVIVIEAGLTGGTFAAGQKALELRQPLFVVASQDLPKSAAGNAALLRQGGQPLRCEAGVVPDLTGVFQALEGPDEPSVVPGDSDSPAEVRQRDLFDDSEKPE
jgi:DNA protecting protein DprA